MPGFERIGQLADLAIQVPSPGTVTGPKWIQDGSLACIGTVCDVCGLTETYSVHAVKGLAELIGVPPPGEPIV